METYFENKVLGFFVKTNGYFSKLLFSGIGHIVTLHRVLPNSNFTIPENKSLEITPLFLENLFNFYIKNNYEFASLDTLYEILQKRVKKNKKIVVFTFDDGYSDIFYYAYPIFKKFNVPLNLYLTTSFPENKAILWWYLIEDLIKNKEKIFFNYKGKIIDLNCKTLDEKQKVFIYFRMLIINNYNEYLNIFKNIFSENGIEILGRSNEYVLNWDQIIEMSKNPLVCIGAHTVNHPIFNKLTDEEIVNEVLTSKTIIENKINKEVNHFAYPYGGKDEVGKREFKILKRLNFKTCTTTRDSNIFMRHCNHLECLPRIHIGMHLTDEKLKYLIFGITQFNKNKFKRIITD